MRPVTQPLPRKCVYLNKFSANLSDLRGHSPDTVLSGIPWRSVTAPAMPLWDRNDGGVLAGLPRKR